MLGGALVPLAALLPIVAVQSAPDCPDVATLVDSLDQQIDASGRARATAGASGEYVLRVAAPAPDRLQVRIADGGGRIVLSRDMPAANSTCDARAHAVAVVVERWLAALPAPPEGLAGGADAAIETPRPLLDVHAGPALAVGFELADPFAGLALRVGVRPLSWLRFAVGGVVFLPHDQDVTAASVSVGRATFGLDAATVPWDGRFRLEVGPSLRVELTTVAAAGVPGATTESRAWPAVGAGAALSTALGRRARIALVAEGWLALTGHTFFVGAEAGREDVYRTPLAGLQVDLLAGYDLL